MVTEDDYKTYFGVETAPTNFTRLEFLALEEIKSIITCEIPEETDDNYENFQNALLEQINYFDLNSDLIDYSSFSGASLGKFNEGNGNISNTSNSSKISPMTYKILLNMDCLYVGMC